ncbi:MAG TPA: hypothetical protein VGN39_07965 [Terriglobales bacterium]|jgi:hypothetical protein|nr:hypothetical protein [Terriglobales bacterium]
MTQKNPDNVEMESRSEVVAPRKHYEKPAFKFERVFETMALHCGKTSPIRDACKFNRKSS